MSILTRIFRRAPLPNHKSPNTHPPVLTPWLTTTPIFPIGDYFVFAQQGYLRNELVYRGLNMLAGAIAEAPLRVYNRNGEALEDHPLRALIKRPNPFMGEHLLWETTVLYLYLSGNAFWVKVRTRSGRVAELWPLRPDRLRIIPDDRKFVGGYIYEIGGRHYPLDTDDVVHFKFPHPLYDYWGLSPLQAALRRIVIDNETADFTKVLLQNNATPSIAVTTQNAIDQATADRLSLRWRERFGGRNRGGPAFLQAGMDVKTIGLSMKDLAFPDLDASSQKRVLVALGVPPVLLGQEATFSNYAQARVSFYEDTAEPLESRLDDRLESDLLYADFDASHDLELKFDTSHVSALRPVRELRWQNAQAGVQGGWLTVNRALAMVGEAPEPDGDVYLRPQTTLAIPVASVAASSASSGDDAPDAAAQYSDGDSAAAAICTHGDRIRAELAHQARDVIRILEMYRRPLSAESVTEIAAEIAALTPRWSTRAIRDAALPATSAEQLARQSVAEVTAVLTAAAQSSASPAELRAQLSLKFQEWNHRPAKAIDGSEGLRTAATEPAK
jgi:HK97 family phage portal protein